MPLRKIDQIAKFQAVDEDALIIPKETIEKVLPGVLELNKRDAAKLIKPERKPPSEAQIEARKKFAEYAKQKAQERKEAKQKADEEAKEQAKQQLKVKQEELLKAATHVKVVVKPHKLPKSGKRVKKVETTDTETTDITETETDITDTETDTDMEDYKQKARKARVQAKKVVRTIKKIDQVLQAPVPTAPQNPYAALLASRWR